MKDEEEVPRMGEAFLAYEKEHSHRARMSKYQVERAVSAFLNHAFLHVMNQSGPITREACKNWRNVPHEWRVANEEGTAAQSCDH
jgi:hypothetical protein